MTPRFPSDTCLHEPLRHPRRSTLPVAMPGLPMPLLTEPFTLQHLSPHAPENPS